MSMEQTPPESPLDQAVNAVSWYDFRLRQVDNYQADPSDIGSSRDYYVHLSRLARIDMMMALSALDDGDAARALANNSHPDGDGPPTAATTIENVRVWRAVLGGGVESGQEISEIDRRHVTDDLRYRQLDAEADNLFDTEANFRETIDALRQNPDISAADMANIARIVAACMDYTPEPQLGDEVNTREGAINAIESCFRTQRACERWEQGYEEAETLDESLERFQNLEIEIADLKNKSAAIEEEWGVGKGDADALEELRAKAEELQKQADAAAEAADGLEEVRGEINECEDEQVPEAGAELGRAICAAIEATRDEDEFHRLYTVLKDDPRVSSDVVIDVAWVLTGQEHEDRDQALGAIEGEFYARGQGLAQEQAQAQGHGR